MPGLGTIVNVLAIVAGGMIGLFGGRFLTKRFQVICEASCGLATLFLGVGGVMQRMLSVDGTGPALTSSGSMMMIASLVLGSLLGEWLRIEQRMASFGEWLKQKSGNGSDNSFVGAFVTGSLTVCIGAMAVLGSIEDGIYANHSILFTKAVLDFIIILIMAASLGKGCIFSALSVGIWQGLITALSRFLQPVMTDQALNNLSYVGNVMIACVGANLILGAWEVSEEKRFKVGNMLPGLLIAVVWAFLPWG